MPDIRVTQRSMHENLFAKLGKLQKSTVTLEQRHQVIHDSKPGPLHQFFAQHDWDKVISQYLLAFQVLKVLGGEQDPDLVKNNDKLIQVMLYSSMDWIKGTKSKNTHRDYAPWISAVIFEYYYSQEYRPSLFKKTSAQSLRDQLNAILSKQLPTSYPWWDKINGHSGIPTPDPESFSMLDRVSTQNRIVNKLSGYVRGLESLAMSQFSTSNSSSPSVPSEIAHALDVLIKVHSSLLLFISNFLL